VYEHIDEKHAVRVIGPDGAEMETITKDDTEPDYDIQIVTSADELNESQQDMERKAAAMERIAANPALITLLNPKWLVEQELRIGGWEDEDIKRALDTTNDATDDVISDAEKNIERALQKKPLKPARNATTGYLQRIHNFLADNQDLKPEVRAALEQHFDEHVPIAEENKARQMQGVAGQNPEEQVTQQPYANTGQAPNPLSQVQGPAGQAPVGGMGAGMQPPTLGA
jgi:hypothetical protein